MMKIQMEKEVLQLLGGPEASSHTYAFRLLGDGFYYCPPDGVEEFLAHHHQIPSRRMRLKLLVNRYLPKRTQVRHFHWPFADKPVAIKIANGTVHCWGQEHFFKIPCNSNSLARFYLSREAAEALKATSISSLLLPMEFKCVHDVDFMETPLGWHLRPKEDLPLVDTFLVSMFGKSLVRIDENQFSRGWEHGDFHFNNILRYNVEQLGIIDIDQYQPDGFPFVDLIEFVAHYFGFFIFKDYIRATHLLLHDPHAYVDLLRREGMEGTARLWQTHFQPAYLPQFVNNRLSWLEANSHCPKFKKQFFEILNRTDA